MTNKHRLKPKWREPMELIGPRLGMRVRKEGNNIVTVPVPDGEVIDYSLTAERSAACDAALFVWSICHSDFVFEPELHIYNPHPRRYLGGEEELPLDYLFFQDEQGMFLSDETDFLAACRCYSEEDSVSAISVVAGLNEKDDIRFELVARFPENAFDDQNPPEMEVYIAFFGKITEEQTDRIFDKMIARYEEVWDAYWTK